MGDGGFQQIIIIGLFLLFGLADLIARWARARVRPAPPEEAAPPRETAPSEAFRPTMRERTAPTREALVRSAPPRGAQVRSAPVRPVASRLASRGITALDRSGADAHSRRQRGVLFTADDARRGVIAMTVLGPCRALEDTSRMP